MRLRCRGRCIVVMITFCIFVTEGRVLEGDGHVCNEGWHFEGS